MGDSSLSTKGDQPLLGLKPSRESLSQHPLLGSTPATSEQDGPPSPENRTKDSPTVLPYKPRAPRHGGSGGGSTGSVASTVPPPLPFAGVTTAPSAIFQAMTPSSISGSVTSSGLSNVTARLREQSVKAAVQRMGLGNNSLGMQMIENLFDKNQVSRSSGDWADLLKILTVGKATLLLPSSPSSPLPITPQVLRDHVVFNTSNEENGVFVTLSGLMGTIEQGRVTIQSCLPVDSTLMDMLKQTETRSQALANIHSLYSLQAVLQPALPCFSILGEQSTIPFPSPPPSVSSSRSSVNQGSTIVAPAPVPDKVSRLNPFMSLFGSHSNTPTPAPVPSRPASIEVSDFNDRATQGSLSPRTASLLSVDVDGKDGADVEGYNIPAWVIDRVIKYGDVSKSLGKAVRGRVTNRLSDLPDKIIDRTSKFLLSAHPYALNGKSGQSMNNTGSATPVVEMEMKDPDAASQAIQNFLEAIYDELYAHYVAAASVVPESPSALGTLMRKGSDKRREVSGTGPTEKDAETTAVEIGKRALARRKLEDDAEASATVGTERVETLLCETLYNHLFSPSSADDSRHDEALSSRIAALNLLDLSLHHLGVQTTDEAARGDSDKQTADLTEGLARITQDVGSELHRLNDFSSRSPRVKTEILINAHKIIIDGLAKLPPIKLRPDGEPAKPSRPTSPIPLEDLGGETPRPPPLPPRPKGTGASSISSLEPPDRPPIGERTWSELTDLVLPDAAKITPTEAAMRESILVEESPNGDVDKGSLARITSHTSEPPPSFNAGSSGADLLLPLAIFSIVKSNPKQLVSHLLYTQRYRSGICLTGEASYAIVNMTAVVEFLEHVDLAELGLGDSADKVMSVANLSPIGIAYFDDSHADSASFVSTSSRFRGRVSQVGELAGSAADSANKVLTGVVDSGWSALRGLIAPPIASNSTPEGASDPPTKPTRPTIPTRKTSAFSIHSVTASVASIAAAAAAPRERPRAPSWAANREMVDVSSRPVSVREVGEDTDSGGDDTSDEEGGDEEALTAEREGKTLPMDQLSHRPRAQSDARSIVSVSSAMSKVEPEVQSRAERQSISDRFASMSVLGRLASPMPQANPSPTSFFSNLTSGNRPRASSLLASQAPEVASTSTPTSPIKAPAARATPPTVERFMTCDAGDLRLSEIGELLRAYRDLATYLETK